MPSSNRKRKLLEDARKKEGKSCKKLADMFKSAVVKSDAEKPNVLTETAIRDGDGHTFDAAEKSESLLTICDRTEKVTDQGCTTASNLQNAASSENVLTLHGNGAEELIMVEDCFVSSASEDAFLCKSASNSTDEGAASQGQIPNDEATKKKKGHGHKVGFETKWRTEFPWIRCDISEGKELLYCQLCKDHLTNDSRYKNSLWITRGTATVRLDKIKQHAISEMHNNAISIETTLINEANAAQAKCSEDSPMFKAVGSAMKCLNFLINHNIPHTTIFRPFIEFCIEELESPILAPLKKTKDATASYTSYETINEFISSMAETQRESIIDSIQSSPCFSLMADETTDKTERKHLAVSARYIKDGNPIVSFLKDVQIPNGAAETIFVAISPIINECGGFHKMSGFGSDGARVMVGEINGVATKVTDKNPKIITIHCHNHRLALAAKDSYEENSSLQKFDETVKALYKYYKNSSVRSSSLSEVQNILNKGKFTKLKRVSFTRWLSHEEAINSIRVNFQNIIVDLENAVAAENSNNKLKGPTPQGLLKNVKSYDFFQWVHFMCDTLAVIKKLTLFFERREVDLSAIEGKVAVAQKSLEKLKRKPGGEFCNKLDEQARKLGIPAPVGEIANNRFKKQTTHFIDTLIQNISERMENVPIISSLGILDLRQAQEEDCSTNYGASEMVELAEYFDINKDDLLVEWDDFKSVYLNPDFKSENLSIQNLSKILYKSEARIGQRFPLVQRLLNIAITLPLSTAEVERVFSQVTLILTDHRNRLKVENTDNLLMTKLNGEPNYISAVKHWQIKKKYRTFFL